MRIDGPGIARCPVESTICWNELELLIREAPETLVSSTPPQNAIGILDTKTSRRRAGRSERFPGCGRIRDLLHGLIAAFRLGGFPGRFPCVVGRPPAANEFPRVQEKHNIV